MQAPLALTPARCERTAIRRADGLRQTGRREVRQRGPERGRRRRNGPGRRQGDLGGALADLGPAAEHRVPVLDLEVGVPRQRHEQPERERDPRDQRHAPASDDAQREGDGERARRGEVDPQPDRADELRGAEDEPESHRGGEAPLRTREQSHDEDEREHREEEDERLRVHHCRGLDDGRGRAEAGERPEPQPRSPGEHAADEHEQQLVADVLANTGITLHRPPRKPAGYGIQSDRLERWGAPFNRDTWTLETILATDRHPRSPLSDVADVNPPRTRLIAADKTVTFVPMDAVCSITGQIVGAEDRPFQEVARGYTAFEERDVIWAKITPCMENGKSAVANNLTNQVGFGSTEFHVIRSKDEQQVLPEYLWCLLRLRAIRDAATRYFTGAAGQQRVPDGFLKRLTIPVPAIQLQQSIVDAVRERRTIIEDERAGVNEDKQKIIEELEQAIIAGRFANSAAQ